MSSIRLVSGVVFGGLFLSTSAGADTYACAAIDDRDARLQCFNAIEATSPMGITTQRPNAKRKEATPRRQNKRRTPVAGY